MPKIKKKIDTWDLIQFLALMLATFGGLFRGCQ